MLRFYKDSNDKIHLVKIKSFFNAPEDWTLVVENPESFPMSKFREAWRDDGNGGISLDLPTARQIKLDEIRSKRNEILQKTDARYLEELSKGADTTAIEADKVALRDMPADAETALNSKIKDTTIDSYDAFADLTLSEDY